jgi:hypothetical protein
MIVKKNKNKAIIHASFDEIIKASVAGNPAPKPKKKAAKKK